MQKMESIYSSQHEFFPRKDAFYRWIFVLIIAVF